MATHRHSPDTGQRRQQCQQCRQRGLHNCNWPQSPCNNCSGSQGHQSNQSAFALANRSTDAEAQFQSNHTRGRGGRFNRAGRFRRGGGFQSSSPDRDGDQNLETDCEYLRPGFDSRSGQQDCDDARRRRSQPRPPVSSPPSPAPVPAASTGSQATFTTTSQTHSREYNFAGFQSCQNADFVQEVLKKLSEIEAHLSVLTKRGQIAGKGKQQQRQGKKRANAPRGNRYEQHQPQMSDAGFGGGVIQQSFPRPNGEHSGQVVQQDQPQRAPRLPGLTRPPSSRPNREHSGQVLQEGQQQPAPRLPCRTQPPFPRAATLSGQDAQQGQQQFAPRLPRRTQPPLPRPAASSGQVPRPGQQQLAPRSPVRPTGSAFRTEASYAAVAARPTAAAKPAGEHDSASSGSPEL